MPAPVSPAAAAEMVRRLVAPQPGQGWRGVLLALDFDGTLAPIVPRPDDARAAPGVPGMVQRWQAAGATVAVITGRPAAAVLALGDLAELARAAPPAGIVVAGHYGLEVYRAGVLHAPAPAAGVAVVRAALPALLARSAPGARIEDKQHALVVHTRGLPDPEAALRDLDPTLRRWAADAGLEVVPGRMVRELRPPGVDKGTALRSLISAAGQPLHAVIVAGDDLGDLPMFAAAGELAAGGFAVARVAVASDGGIPAVLAAADVSVGDPAALVALLTALVSDSARRFGATHRRGGRHVDRGV